MIKNHFETRALGQGAYWSVGRCDAGVIVEFECFDTGAYARSTQALRPCLLLVASLADALGCLSEPLPFTPVSAENGSWTVSLRDGGVLVEMEDELSQSRPKGAMVLPAETVIEVISWLGRQAAELAGPR